MGRGDGQTVGNKLRAAAKVGQVGEQWGNLFVLQSTAQRGPAVPVLSPLTLSLALLQGCLLLSPALLLVCAEAGKTLSSVPGWTLSWSSNQLSLSVLCKSLNFALLEVELSGLL